MALHPLLNRIDELQAAIEAAGKFDPEVLKRINYKFRLEWNYHSNAMEGNSLTKEETRSVMVNNVTVEGKPLKDVLEMKGHDEVITDILKISKGELGLSEKRIKEIHKAIIHEADPGKKQKIGQWKTGNNHLINYKHEKFDFIDHSEVPDAMHELMNWLNAQTQQWKDQKNDLHPALIAFEFHLKYLTIHPFYDGNGRTARIFTNLILISSGYPPVIIKKEEKEMYYRYLADVQGYGGNPDLYYEFMCKLLIHSQELVLKAINGESIDDPDDLDKGIELLKRTLAISKDDIQKSPEVIIELWEKSLRHMVESFFTLHDKFKGLFENSYVNIYATTNEKRTLMITEPGARSMFFSMPSRLAKLTDIKMVSELSKMRNYPSQSKSIYITVNFSNFNYSISNAIELNIEKKYSELLTKSETDDFLQRTGNYLLYELNSIANINKN
jgi:Fic family protein